MSNNGLIIFGINKDGSQDILGVCDADYNKAKAIHEKASDEMKYKDVRINSFVLEDVTHKIDLCADIENCIRYVLEQTRDNGNVKTAILKWRAGQDYPELREELGIERSNHA